MPTAEETAFMQDPAAFMRANIIRVVCAKSAAGQYNFALTRNDTVSARQKNRKGASVGYYELRQSDTGAIAMHFLPYADNDVREATLPIAPGTADLMVTVNLNGCSFGYAQSSANGGAYVTHHNDRSHGNDPANIEAQTVNNPFADPFQYFHQSQYRKSRGVFSKTPDGLYQATIIGKRDNHNRWHFYCQSRKDLFGSMGQKFWSLKGVTEINP